MDDAVALSRYKTSEVARMLGWSRARRALQRARSGYVHPERGRRGEFLFTFRTWWRCARSRSFSMPASRSGGSAQALGRLVEDLPAERTLAGVRIVADGDRVVVEDGDEIWNPESGQRVLDFRRR